MIDYTVVISYNVTMEKLGEVIKADRLRLKLRIKDLAEKVGVHPTYITYIEKHGKIPSSALMAKIKNVLDDEMLDTIYLRTKYPDVCRKFEQGQKDIADEFIEKAGRLVKKDMTPEEKKEVRKQLNTWKAKLHELAVKFAKTIKDLNELEKTYLIGTISLKRNRS